MSEPIQVIIPIEDELEKQILKDTLADSKKSKEETIKRIFDIGMSIISTHISKRNPRLNQNIERWLNDKEDADEEDTV